MGAVCGMGWFLIYWTREVVQGTTVGMRCGGGSRPFRTTASSRAPIYWRRKWLVSIQVMTQPFTNLENMQVDILHLSNTENKKIRFEVAVFPWRHRFSWIWKCRWLFLISVQTQNWFDFAFFSLHQSLPLKLQLPCYYKHFQTSNVGCLKFYI